MIPEPTHRLKLKSPTGELQEVDLVETATEGLFTVLETEDLQFGTSYDFWIEPLEGPPV